MATAIYLTQSDTPEAICNTQGKFSLIITKCNKSILVHRSVNLEDETYWHAGMSCVPFLVFVARGESGAWGGKYSYVCPLQFLRSHSFDTRASLINP